MSLFYKFYLFKSPGYLIAWNALLGIHTFQSLDRDHKLAIYFRAMALLQQAGGDPHGETSGLLFSCFISQAIAEAGIPPRVKDGTALRWYPILNPPQFMHHCREPEVMLARVKADIAQQTGVVLPNYDDMENPLEI